MAYVQEKYSPEALVFRPFLPWFLAKIALLLGLGTLCLLLAGQWHDLRWLLGAAANLAGAILLATHYLTCGVGVDGHSLTIRSGLFRTKVRRVPLWQADLAIRQTLLGRIFDYGTLEWYEGEQVALRMRIAPMRLFRYVTRL